MPSAMRVKLDCVLAAAAFVGAFRVQLGTGDDVKLLKAPAGPGYDVVLDVPMDAVDIAFGFLLNGKGEVLADDLKLEEVAKDIPLTSHENHLPDAPVNLDFSL